MTDTLSQNIVAIDVGGTHTDAVLLTGTGTLHVSKVRSTPGAPEKALLTALHALLAQASLKAGDVTTVVHGTTVATNAILTGELGRVGLITTEGFRDVLDIGTQQRASLYDPWTPKPAPLVDRELRLEAIERVAASGDIVTELDLQRLEEAVRAFDGSVDAIAVVLLFSFVNDAHERRIGEFLRRRFPGIPVSLSSQVAPEFREYVRTSTTVVNAALLPKTGGYLRKLGQQLRDEGFTGSFQIMQSSGGVVPSEVAQDNPVSLLVSGPAAGAVAAARVGNDAGFPDVVMLDVGGTSADVALVTGGEPRRRYLGEVDGRPVNVPQIDVTPIGAGGGSIARVDEFGALLVGPESAGADPGPAAYGVNDKPTLTDAHLVLGILNPDRFLGGAIPLDAARSHDAIRREVAEPLGLSVVQAAAAIIAVANGKMAGALRMATVSRGFDVRRCALVAFGGAGPLHACAIAEQLGITSVVVPRYPGLTSALGLVLSDGRYDVSRTFIVRTRAVDLTVLGRVVGEMSAKGRDFLEASGALETGRIEVDLDLRYAGQAYELTVGVRGGIVDADALLAVEASFHDMHREAYGHSWADRETEIVTIRLRAVIPHAAPEWAVEESPTADDGRRQRDGWTSTGAEVSWHVLDRDHAPVGLEGPALLEQLDSTVVVAPGWRVTSTRGSALVMEQENAE